MVNINNRLTLTAKESGVVKLFSLNGRLIFEQNISEGIHKVELPSATGLYIVQLFQSNYVVTEKINVIR